MDKCSIGDFQISLLTRDFPDFVLIFSRFQGCIEGGVAYLRKYLRGASCVRNHTGSGGILLDCTWWSLDKVYSTNGMANILIF